MNKKNSESVKDEVWNKASTIHGKNPDVYRKDSCGNTIKYGSYGTKGEYGWEIDHKHPVAKGGSDTIRNLQPLHWEENKRKSDKYPYSGK